MAGVNMRLEPGAVRSVIHDLDSYLALKPLQRVALAQNCRVGICSQGRFYSHESSNVVISGFVQGKTQVTAVDQNGRNYVDTVVCAFYQILFV